MARFKIGDPVVILTDRKLRGVVGRVDLGQLLPLELTPQSFRGQKGWIENYPRPWQSIDIHSYTVVFRLLGSSRAVLVKRFEGDDWEWPIATEEKVSKGFGNLVLRLDELVHDPEPEEDYSDLPGDPFQYEGWEDAIPMFEKAYWLLKAREATLAPELYVAGLREHSPQMSVEKIPESLGRVIAEWRRFEEGYYGSISNYIGAYIALTDLDWAHVLSAVEQAEEGDSTAFTDLMRRFRIDPYKFVFSSFPSREGSHSP